MRFLPIQLSSAATAHPTHFSTLGLCRVIKFCFLSLDDIVVTIINTVSLIARTQRRPPFDSFFLLNNIAYLRKNILEPRQESLIDYLTKPTQDILNSNFRTAKASYLDANFSPLMQSLSDDPKEKGKAATKEKFTRFYDLLEEVLERHRLAKVLEDDAESREAIGNDVIKFLIPSLKAFTQKHKEKEFSKSKPGRREKFARSLLTVYFFSKSCYDS